MPPRIIVATARSLDQRGHLPRLASVVLAAVWFVGVRAALMVDDNLADFGGDES